MGNVLSLLKDPRPFELCKSLLLLSRSVMSNSYNPTDCSKPGFPVLHYLPEFVKTHVHWVSDAIQSSHLLLPPSPPALNLSQIRVFFQWLFTSCGQSIGVSASVLIVNIQGWFPLGLTGLIYLLSKGLSRVFSRYVVGDGQPKEGQRGKHSKSLRIRKGYITSPR